MSTKPTHPVSKPSAAAVAPKTVQGKTSSQSSQSGITKMHRRSRSGCFTCRLRRKKCDEGKPGCRACRNLGIECEYKRPTWWSDNGRRKSHKELIKTIIKQTKLSEKATKASRASLHGMGGNTPPGLSHSLPTSATYSDVTGYARATSEDSQCSFDFAQSAHNPFDVFQQPHVYNADLDAHAAFQGYPPAPYEVGIKTSTTEIHYHPAPHTLATVPEHDWQPEGMFDDVFETPDFNYFDFSYVQHPSQSVVQVDECDRPLLEHFLDSVVPLIFPILEVNQTADIRSQVILPALEHNKCYLHCCLSIAAIHMKSLQPAGTVDEQLDAAIVRHRFATISELCEVMGRDTDHAQMLDAVLALIFFQCTVGRPDDTLPDIAWHQHFDAGVSLVRKLALPEAVLEMQKNNQRPPFNMTLAAWIDIMGATMRGRAPQFADTYRNLNLGGASCGLSELMGCDDRMMFLISEIACLEALKVSGSIDDTNLCTHITLLAQQIDQVEVHPTQLESAVTNQGNIHPKSLTRNITALYCTAARIWLISMIPATQFEDGDASGDAKGKQAPAMRNLIAQFADLLANVPTGPAGFDRSIVWPMLVAGANSLPGDRFRAAFEDRMRVSEDTAATGALGRMRRVLTEVWRQEEEAGHATTGVHWRDVMKSLGWEYLLL